MFRILIDREPLSGKRVQRYLAAIDDMVGIHCAYINVTEHPYLLGDYQELEYCLVEGRTKFCSEWKLRDSDDVKAHVLTTHPLRYGQYLESWNGLVAHIRAPGYCHAGFTKRHQERLLKLKSEFLSAYDSAIVVRRKPAGKPGKSRPSLSRRPKLRAGADGGT